MKLAGHYSLNTYRSGTPGSKYPKAIIFGTGGSRLQRHIDAQHRGQIDPDCPACCEIQERYGNEKGKNEPTQVPKG